MSVVHGIWRVQKCCSGFFFHNKKKHCILYLAHTAQQHQRLAKRKQQ